jgi:hypothetical protein
MNFVSPTYILSAGILEQSMGARNRVGIGLSYWPARLQSLAESIPWIRYLDSLNVYKYTVVAVYSEESMLLMVPLSLLRGVNKFLPRRLPKCFLSGSRHFTFSNSNITKTLKLNLQNLYILNESS